MTVGCYNCVSDKLKCLVNPGGYGELWVCTKVCAFRNSISLKMFHHDSYLMGSWVCIPKVMEWLLLNHVLDMAAMLLWHLRTLLQSFDQVDNYKTTHFYSDIKCEWQQQNIWHFAEYICMKKIASVLQIALWNTFSRFQIVIFLFKFKWNQIRRFLLTISPYVCVNKHQCVIQCNA